MNSNDLSKAQARKMHAAPVPALRYLNRLYERLNARRFSPEDRLYRATVKAQAALGELVILLHYLSCDGGRRAGPSRVSTDCRLVEGPGATCRDMPPATASGEPGRSLPR